MFVDSSKSLADVKEEAIVLILDVGVIFACVVEISVADVFAVGVSSVPVVGVAFSKLVGTLAVDEETALVSVVGLRCCWSPVLLRVNCLQL